MNMLRHLLVHVNDDVLSRQALRLGAVLARQHGARLCALLAVGPVARGAYLNAETAALAVQLEQQNQAAHHAAAEVLVHAVGAECGLDIELAVGDGPPVDALIRGARSTDLLVVSQREPRGGHNGGGLDGGAAARLLMAAGCPVLLVPHIGWGAGASGSTAADPRAAQNVLVAWSDTRETARALRDALPLLQAARQVELVSFLHADAETGERVPLALQAALHHLARHGVNATATVRRSREPSLAERMRRPWTPDASVAEALLSQAADTQADLVVMGGYGHSRAWELVLGGVTRTLLQTMTVPVLMSH